MGNMNEIRKKKVVSSLSFWFIPLSVLALGCCSGLVPPAGEAERKTSFLTLTGISQCSGDSAHGSQAGTPTPQQQLTALCELLQPDSAHRGIFLSWLSGMPRVLLQGLAVKGFLTCPDAGACLGMLSQHEARLIINENSKAIIW